MNQYRVNYTNQRGTFTFLEYANDTYEIVERYHLNDAFSYSISDVKTGIGSSICSSCSVNEHISTIRQTVATCPIWNYIVDKHHLNSSHSKRILLEYMIPSIQPQE